MTIVRRSTTPRSRHGRCITLAVAFAVSVSAMPSVASSSALRHLRLLRSFPAADTVLASSPDAVRLWLSDAAELPTTKITVRSSAGKPVQLARITRAGTKDAPLVSAFAAPVGAGTYTVAWRTMSRDGHVVKGDFAFRVGARAAAARE